jgi:CDP-diacylglycerol--serine O-phosphatidyltransferase
MNIKKHIPNIFTLGNLFCGTVATMFAVLGEFQFVAFFVVLGIVLDFFDGFLARILKVQGELGKQLDSLADMVTSGVVPGIVMFMMLNDSTPFFESSAEGYMIWKGITLEWIQLSGLLLTLAAGYRLAKFNIDTRQSDSFIGLPTPAMSLFVIALPLISNQTVEELLSNHYILFGITLLLSYLMNANIRLIALKFKSFGLQENLFKYVLIAFAIVSLITLEILAIPLIILVYVLLSILQNVISKKV